MKTKNSLFLLALVSSIIATQAQNVGINTTGAAPANSAMLDVASANKGLLIPRVALINLTTAAPVVAPVTSLLVYNTATSGVKPNNITPGFYYWNGTMWVSFLDWTLTGNSLTSDSVNFIGTTDSVPLPFRVNNQHAGKIDLSFNNTSMGYQALKPLMRGTDNAAFGYKALASIDTSVIFFGACRTPKPTINGTFGRIDVGGCNTISITGNTAMGSQALFSSTVGSFNVANGFQAAYSNASGSANVAVGAQSLYTNGEGNHNVAIGALALYDNTSTGNVGVGSFSLTKNFGGYNTAVGFNSMVQNTNGYGNVAMGINAGAMDDNGSNNTYIGGGTDATATGLNLNNATAIGYGARVSNSNSLILGSSATYNAPFIGIGTSTPDLTLTVESFKIDDIVKLHSTNPSGASAIQFVSSNNNKEAYFGYGNLTSSLFPLETYWGTTATSNANMIFSPREIEAMRISENGNVAVGTNFSLAKFHANSNAAVTALFTSNAADVDGIVTIRNSNTDDAIDQYLTFQLNNGANAGWVLSNGSGGVNYISLSDRRLKTNINKTTFGLNDLMKINVVDYTMLSDTKNQKQTGFLAQELYEVFPNAVSKGTDDVTKNPWGIDYGKLTPLIISSIQEQQNRIEKLEQQNQELIKRLEKLEQK
jgi:trimeric autotransporter adhesin